MQKDKNLTIFHIYRKDGTSIFLHPFNESEFLLKIEGDQKIIGKYGHEPRVESLTMFRNDLYRIIESAVKNWIGDIRFIPRFIISAVAFLIIYLIAAVVIKDPIPIIDELALSFGGSIALFFILAKRDQSSDKASKKRLDLRVIMDSIVFEEDNFVKEVEKILHHNESIDKDSLLDSMAAVDEKGFADSDVEDIKQLLFYLEKRFSGKPYRKKAGKISKLGSTSDKKRQLTELARWADNNKIDLSLFAIYRRLKKRIHA